MPEPQNPQPAHRSNISAFIVMDVMAAAAQKLADGEAVVHLEVGEPATPTPALARAAVVKALEGGALGYTPALGLWPLRQRIARHYQETQGITIAPERICITAGSSAAFILAFLAAFDAGDRIAVQTPGYPAYRNTTAALNLEPVILETSAATRWAPTPKMIRAAHASAPLRGVLIASPNNPTGTVIGREDMQDLANVCRDLGLWLISDEIYHGLCFGTQETSALSVNDDAIIINSFSKYWCMTGWRVGWMVGPECLLRPIECLMQNLFICAPHLSQIAALAAMDAQDELEEVKSAYARNRSILMDALPRLGFREILPMDGAFYAYCNIERWSQDSLAFSQKLLKETGIAATPGLDFDPARGHRYIRFSSAGNAQDMYAAVHALEKWLPLQTR